jgi:AAA domain
MAPVTASTDANTAGPRLSLTTGEQLESCPKNWLELLKLAIADDPDLLPLLDGEGTGSLTERMIRARDILGKYTGDPFKVENVIFETRLGALCRPTLAKDAPPAGQSEILNVETSAEWRAKIGQLQPALIPGVLAAHGLAMVASDPKAGKTMLTVDLTLSIANGVPFMGEYPVKVPGRVLWIASEGTREGLAARFDAFSRGKGLSPATAMDNIDFIWRGGTRLDDAATIAELVDLAPDYVLIVCDVLDKLWGGDENSARDVSALMRGLQQVTNTGPTVLVLHHAVKTNESSSARNPWLNMRGSGAFFGAIDSGFFLDRPKAATRTKVLMTSRDEAPAAPFSFAWPTETFTAADTVSLDWRLVDESRRTGVQEQELAAIKFATTTPGLSMTALSELLPGRATTRRDAIKGLLANGTLEARLTPGRSGSGGIHVTGHEQYVPVVGT